MLVKRNIMVESRFLHVHGAPPSLIDLDAMAREALNAVPQELRRLLTDVTIRVGDFPDDEVLEELDCDSPFDLLGLYRGLDLWRRSYSDHPWDRDRILIL